MKSRSVSLLACSAALLAFSAPEAFSQAGSPVPTKPASPSTPEPAKLPSHIRYKPPVSGAPAVRGTGGTRGGGGNLPTLYVLAPEHEALTTHSQPALFWYQSESTKSDFELTLIEPKKPRPVGIWKNSDEHSAGIHSVSLARKKITLEPNVSYRWSVALIPDSKSRSKDIIATGAIRRVEAPAELAAKIAKAPLAERAARYAEAGFWYDALQAISLAIAAEPNNTALHQLRADLLKQVGLKQAAAAEKK
jgi:hypothetical protein